MKRQKPRVADRAASTSPPRRSRKPVGSSSVPRDVRPKPDPTRNLKATRRRDGPAAVVALATVLIACSVWAYSTSFAGVFVLDDVRAIARNSTIRTVWPLSRPLSPPAASTVSGRPVANFSFALNYALAPAGAREVFTTSAVSPTAVDDLLRNVWGYHLLNLLIHLCAALALFGVVRHTLSSDRLRSAVRSSATWLAFVVALVWVLHPLQTGSVTYIVQRVESLMALFYLLTVYCAIRAGEGERAHLWIAGAIASCAFGMATKEVMVTAPIMVWLWDRVFGARRLHWQVFAGLAATWLILAALVWHEHRAPSIDLTGVSVLRYVMTQPAVITHYLRLAVVGSPLVFLYTWPLATSFAEVGWQSLIVAALLVLGSIAALRRHPVGFAGAWFFLILAPTSSMLPIITEVAAEQRMYLPLAAVVACAVTALYLSGRAVVRRLIRVWPPARTAVVPLAVISTAVVVLALGEATRARNRTYWSEEALWFDTVAKQPGNERARLAYATVLSGARRFPEAEEQFRFAISLNPADGTAHARLGATLAEQGRLEEAIGHWKQALALRPDDVEASRWLGVAYAVTHQDGLAVPHLERALENEKDNVDLLARLAAILADSPDSGLRNPLRAVALAERAAALTLRADPLTLDVLAVAQAAAGRFHDAAATAGEALALARARSNAALVSELENRVAAYSARAHVPPRQ